MKFSLVMTLSAWLIVCQAHEPHYYAMNNDPALVVQDETLKAVDDDFELMKGQIAEDYHCDPDHPYRARMENRDPHLMIIDNFISQAEALHLIAIAQPEMQRSKVVADTDENKLSTGRTSFNTFLSRSQDAVVHCIEQRASRIVGKPLANMEPLQVVWYRKGQEYQPHYDYFAQGYAGTDRELKRGGQRIATFFVYLNTLKEDQGGATTFPTLNLNVKPVQGSAAFWYDVQVDGTDDPRTLHGGAPVHYGEKYGLNIWVREGEFN